MPVHFIFPDFSVAGAVVVLLVLVVVVVVVGLFHELFCM